MEEPGCSVPLWAAVRCAVCGQKREAAGLQAALRAATSGTGVCRSSVTVDCWLPVGLGKAHPDGLSGCASREALRGAVLEQGSVGCCWAGSAPVPAGLCCGERCRHALLRAQR